MRCVYCYSRKSSSRQRKKIIDLQFAKVGIDDFFEEFDSKAIRLFGSGEPTLAFNRMREIKEYASLRAGRDLFVEIQTNGFFSESVAKWISKNVNMAWISLDGTPDIQNKYRPTLQNNPTSKIIERNIKIISNRKNTKLGIRVTIGNFNVNVQREIIDYLANLKVNAISVYPIFTPVANKKKQFIRSLELLEPDTKIFVDNFIDAYYYAKEKGIFYGSILTANFDEKVNIACRAMIPTPHLTPDGYVTCCDMAYDSEKILPDLIYGKYDNNDKTIHYFEDKIEVIRRRRLCNLDECKICVAKDYCAGGCIGEALNETSSMLGIKKSNCDIIVELFKRLPRPDELYPYLNP